MRIVILAIALLALALACAEGARAPRMPVRHVKSNSPADRVLHSLLRARKNAAARRAFAAKSPVPPPRPVYAVNGTLPLRELRRRAAAVAAVSKVKVPFAAPLAQPASYSSVCSNGQASCPDGSFCIDNVLCLAGEPEDYSVIELLTVGAVARLMENEVSQNPTMDCLNAVSSSFDDLFTALQTWYDSSADASSKQSAMPYLKKSVSDLSNAFTQCSQTSQQSFWESILSLISDVVSFFDPVVKMVEEAYDTYEMLVNGVNIFDDFCDMLDVCSSTSANNDYIQCGGDLGDIVYIVS